VFLAFILQSLALALLVLGVCADHHDFALAFDDLAFFADRFYGRSYFHGKIPPFTA
jgi:hypothetical protein